MVDNTINGWEFNGEDDVMQYWRGVLDTCQYFKDELGIEDAMDTKMAQEAIDQIAAIAQETKNILEWIESEGIGEEEE